MSYRCKNCGALQKFASKKEIAKAKRLKTKTKLPTHALKVIVETRPKEYETIITKKINGKKKDIVIKSEGWEIVREWDVCERCYSGLRQENRKNTL